MFNIVGTHVSMDVADLDETRRYLEDVCGLEKLRQVTRPTFTVVWYPGLELWQAGPDSTPGAVKHLAWQVDDIDEAVRVLSQTGASFETEAPQAIDVEVVDLRTLRPMDTEIIIASVKKTHRVVILHEACITGGIGGEIAARIADEAFDFIDAPIKRLGVPDVPIPYAKSLENAIVPNEEKLIDCIKNVLAAS